MDISPPQYFMDISPPQYFMDKFSLQYLQILSIASILIAILIIILKFFDQDYPCKNFKVDQIMNDIKKIEKDKNVKILYIGDFLENDTDKKLIPRKYRKYFIDINDSQSFQDTLQTCYVDQKNIWMIINSNGGDVVESDIILTNVSNFLQYQSIDCFVHKKAMSAATLLSLSGNRLFMSPISYLARVDPMIDGTSVPSYRKALDFINHVDTTIEPDISLKDLADVYESEKMYDDGLDTLKGIIMNKKKQYFSRSPSNRKVDQIVDEFASGKFLHHKPLTVSDLKKLGFNIQYINDFMLNEVISKMDHILYLLKV